MYAHFFRFASVKEPEKYAYLVYRSSLDAQNNKSHRPVCDWAAVYETYGDGLCQHSHEWPVQDEQMDDFLISLAAHLVSDQATADDLETVAERWPDYFDEAECRFLAEVRYKPAAEGKPHKTVYYARNLQKVSGSREKRFDKRWEEVPTWADGSLDAVIGLAHREYDSLLATYSRWLQSYDFLRKLKPDYWHQKITTTLKLPEDVECGYHAVNELVASYRSRKAAERAVENYRENLEWKRKRAADQACKERADAEAEAATVPQEESNVAVGSNSVAE